MNQLYIVLRYDQEYEIPEDIVHIPGKCTIDFKKHEITIIDQEKPENLTVKFLILLAFFYNNKNKRLSKYEIFHHMFPPTTDKGDVSQIKTMILNLRKKLNDTKPYTIIIGDTDFGYTFVLEEDGQVSISPIDKEHSTNSVDSNSETSSVRSKKSSINLKIHSQSTWVVNDIKTALGRLVEANDIKQIKLSKSHIYRALDMLFRMIKTPYKRNIGGYNNDIWEEYREGFFQIVTNCWEEIEISEQDPELIDIKLQILHVIYEWHFLTAMLGAQLDLERLAFEMPADMIDKETWQTKINKLDEEYQLAREDADMAERMLDEMINEYDHDLSATKSSI